MTKLEHAHQLRAIQEPHYNCTQSVLVPFAADCGLTPEQAFALGGPFGGGMKIGSTCGAIVGGLMVLGMLGASEESCRAFTRHFQASCSSLSCAQFLKNEKEAKGAGFDKKAHCDDLVYQVIEQVEALLQPGEQAQSRP